ncbi:MAG: hypothetical protein H0U76_08205 [Ktedonobacteraceae bacterium]|nr:hypothetical protein [Ktedonobacteraceae bacterium]
MSDQSNGQVREEQRTRTFNPKEHLIQLKSKEGAKDYLPVQWRLVWFREQCPQGTIDTEEITVDLDRDVEEEVYVWNHEKKRSEKVIKHAKGYARYKAVVTDGRGARATGTKSENAASFPDFIEKAETGSIGRALAALGYGTQFAPDLEEAHRIVDSPVERQLQAVNGNGHSNGNGAAATTRTSVVASNGNGSNGNGANGTNGAHPPESDAQANATEQQVASIRKLSEHLGKAMPEEGSNLTFLNAKKLIQQLTAEYRESRQSNKAS